RQLVARAELESWVEAETDSHRCSGLLLHQVAEDEVQHPAVVQVRQLDVVVDQGAAGERALRAVLAARLYLDLGPGLDPVHAADAESLLAAQPQRRSRLARLELQRQDAHADQVGAVDALE